MMTFDRVDFEKVINVKAKKKIKIESKWELKTLKETVNIEYGTRIVKKNSLGSEYPVYGGGGETFRTNQYNRDSQFIISRFGMSPKCEIKRCSRYAVVSELHFGSHFNPYNIL